MKKITCIMLSFILLLGVISGCSNSNGSLQDEPSTAKTEDHSETKKVSEEKKDSAKTEDIDPLGKYDPPIDLSIVIPRNDSDVVPPEGQTPFDNDWLDIYRDELGINVEVLWAETGEDARQKTELMLSTGDIPDICSFTDPSIYEQLIEADMIQPITDVYEKYATPLLKELLESDGGGTYSLYDRNGEKYALFFFLEPSENYLMLWVREDWRAKLDLPKPKTLDDVQKIATAFTNDDPDGNGKADTTGLTFNNFVGNKLNGFFASFGAYPRLWIRDDSGKVISGKEDTENMKAALSSAANMYKNGEIWNEFLTADQTKMAEKINTGGIGMMYEVWWYPVWPFQLGKNNDPDMDWRCYPIPTASGEPGLTPREKVIPYLFQVVRKDFEHPEAIIKLGNIYAEKYYGESAKEGFPEYSLWKWTAVCVEPLDKELSNFRNIRKALETGDDSIIITGSNKMRYNRYMKSAEDPIGSWGDRITWGPEDWTAYSLLERIEENKWYMNNEHFGAPTETMVKKGSTIDKLYEETVFKIITGELPVDEYDKMLEKYKSLGGDEIAREVEAIYEK